MKKIKQNIWGKFRKSCFFFHFPSGLQGFGTTLRDQSNKTVLIIQELHVSVYKIYHLQAKTHVHLCNTQYFSLMMVEILYQNMWLFNKHTVVLDWPFNVILNLQNPTEWIISSLQAKLFTAVELLDFSYRCHLVFCKFALRRLFNSHRRFERTVLPSSSVVQTAWCWK